MKKIAKKMYHFIHLIKEFITVDLKKVIRNFDKNDGELSTCAIAFFLLISFIPASLVIISILSFFYGSDDMAKLYLQQLKTQLPSINIDDLVLALDKIIYSQRYLAFIWIPFLFWWGSLVFDIIERVLEKAFKVENSRKFWKAKIRHFFIIIGVSFIAVLLTLMNHLFAIFKNSKIFDLTSSPFENMNIIHNFIIYIDRIPFLVTSATTLFLNTIIIYIMYRYVPPKRPDTKSIIKGAFFVSFTYELVKTIFSYYITEINDYSSIFGSLSTIVIFMIWIWYTCFIFVIGAELTWVFYEKSELKEELHFEEQ